MVFFIISAVFFFVSLVLFFIGFYRSNKKKHWVKTVGTYVDRSKLRLGGPKPTVQYSVDGELHEFTSGVKQQFYPKFGQKVTIYYHPNKPNKVIIDTFIQSGGLFKLIGLVFFLVSLGMFLFNFTSFALNIYQFVKP